MESFQFLKIATQRYTEAKLPYFEAMLKPIQEPYCQPTIADFLVTAEGIMLCLLLRAAGREVSLNIEKPKAGDVEVTFDGEKMWRHVLAGRTVPRDSFERQDTTEIDATDVSDVLGQPDHLLIAELRHQAYQIAAEAP